MGELENPGIHIQKNIVKPLKKFINEV